MKGNKLVTLDIEIIAELKKVPNASQLVNGMLIDYFYAGGGQEKAELEHNIITLQDRISKDKLAIDTVKDKIKDIDKKEQEMKKKFKNIPFSILQDFKQFDKMSEDALMSRYNEHYFGKVEWKELLKAYKEYFKK